MTYQAGVRDMIKDVDFGKANASTVGGLVTKVEALERKVPEPSLATPAAEAVGGDPGTDEHKYSLEGHRHPRLTSTTGNRQGALTHVIGSNGTATIGFTRTFSAPPGTVFTEVPPITGTMSGMPASFRVENWVLTDGLYTGCVVRCWRGQTLPTLSTVSGILTVVISGVNTIVSRLTGFNPFGAASQGTSFSCIAVARSDV